ncbi:MAG: hypothetical protein ACYC6T_11575 [Thermoleophilia bacterium]
MATTNDQGRTTVALTLRQRMLVHVVVQRFDRETQTTVLDPETLAVDLSAPLEEVASDIDELLLQGYVTRPDGCSADDPTWVLEPTDRAVLSAMGLE